MRPFFPYYGSTWNRARYLPRPLFPEVCEPFAGGAGYSLFYDVPLVHLIDANPVIAGLWSYLLRVSPSEILALPELPEVGDSVDNYPIAQEAKWLIGFWLNRGSAAPKKSRTSYSARTDKAQLNWGRRAKERIARQLPDIAGWTVQEGGYEQALPQERTWLIDPPYVEKGRYYPTSFSQYDALGEWCREREGQVIVLEGTGATWLPFEKLGSFKTSLSRADEFVWVKP